MSEPVVSDSQIAAMSPAERGDLIRRLERPLEELLPPAVLHRIRRIRMSVMVGATIALIPWIIFLAFTLPTNYNAHHWAVTWVGFDVLLVTFMAATAVLGWLRRQLILISGTLRIVRLTVTRLWLLDPGMPLWRLPLLP